MTRLTSVTVEGFKGIDRIEFDPGRLNVVTGRNNSGKTSLLEALNLAYEPASIARFGPNLDTVVNGQYEEAVIEAETAREDRELRFKNPEEQKVLDYLLEAFRQELYRTWDYLAPEGQSEKELKEVIDNILPEALASVDESGVLEEAARETTIVSVDGSAHPYIYYGPAVTDLYAQIREGTRKAVDDRIKDPESTSGLRAYKLKRSTRRGEGDFIQGEPVSLGTTNFVDFNQLASTLEFDEDDADPVKVDNIGDYLREHGILEDLKTFDVDHLVFESEDGEKYSVPFEFMGEGFKTIVGVLWELLGEEHDWDLVLLEEPETHMHPGYVRELVYFLVQLAREEDVQLFVTTHNNDFLNDFFEANFTEDEQTFLEDEFRLLQLQDGTADVMDYAEAEEDLKDLKLDLRGL